MYETITVDVSDGIATVRLVRPPANAINGQMCRELVRALDVLEADDAVQGLVLQGRPGMFSGGLDVIALYPLEWPEMRAFWQSFTGLFARLYQTPLVTAAAIAGHAPAGGCVLAIACDYRVMAQGPYRIGLNEVAVGLPVPVFLCRVFAALVGQREAERLLPVGAMLSPDEALGIGLVDRVLAAQEVAGAAREFVLSRVVSVPRLARARTKANVRGVVGGDLGAGLQGEVEQLMDGWFGDECRSVMGGLVRRLTARAVAAPSNPQPKQHHRSPRPAEQQ